VLLIGFCLLGLLRFQLETDPQRLWVGPTSQAARDKANYEASFGPFYRVTQLIVSTTPASKSPYVAPSGLPSVVTDANIQLLFDMQAEVDAISGRRAATVHSYIAVCAHLLRTFRYHRS
jgi:Niemann-Pick C1 protein